MKYMLPSFLLFFFLGCQGDLTQKGSLCLTLGDYPMAIDFFKRELSHDPGNYQARLGLGKGLLQKAVDKKGDDASWDYALIQLEACRTLKPSGALERLLSDAYTERSRMLLRRQDTASALNHIMRAVELNVDDVDPVNLAGIIYFRRGEVHKASALFQRAIAIDSTHPSAWFNLGMISWQEGEIAKSRQNWYKALSLAPGDEDALYWFALAEKRTRQGAR